MMCQNEMRLEFDSRSCNESFARVAVAAFMTQLNPTLEEVADVKTAVSEAVTNSIIHAYGEPFKRTQLRSLQEERCVEKIEITCRICGNVLEVEVRDTGCGIADVKRAMEPMFTTRAECDRAGMGFAFMEAFMDTLEVDSKLGKGTTVRMSKRIARENTAHLETASAERRRADGWNTPLR
ncbi:MAG: anti-sigma F factor [Lachnospiraceae bacterium]|nr:anti-sigma F factor [Lachnospiraceae bacterium]